MVINKYSATNNEENECTAQLIITSQNRFYLTGFRSSLGYLFIVNGKKTLYIDGRYIEAARSGVYSDVEVRQLYKLSSAISEITEENGVEKLLCEVDITVREKQRIEKLAKIPLKASLAMTDEILKERSIKTERELESIEKAQRIAEKAFLNVLDRLKAGVTEREAALWLDYEMRLGGAEGSSFETIAVSGKNSSKPHGVPTDKPLENGDFLTMDFGAIYGGYCSDMTRTVAIGFATEEMEEVYSTVLNAQLTGINKAKCGVKASDVDKAARSVIENAGYGEYFNHSTGHGVGIDIHELPFVAESNNEILQTGNVITCEPGIYIPEKFGVRIEDMLFITENGCKNLTNSEKKLIIIK